MRTRSGARCKGANRRDGEGQHHQPDARSHDRLVDATVTIYVDGVGHARQSVPLASWVYGTDGMLAAKTGVIGFKGWYTHAVGDHTPRGEVDSPPPVTQVETALERPLSGVMMRGRPATGNGRGGRHRSRYRSPNCPWVSTSMDGPSVLNSAVEGMVIKG